MKKDKPLRLVFFVELTAFASRYIKVAIAPFLRSIAPFYIYSGDTVYKEVNNFTEVQTRLHLAGQGEQYPNSEKIIARFIMCLSMELRVLSRIGLKRLSR
jgi:hypothetical protein